MTADSKRSLAIDLAAFARTQWHIASRNQDRARAARWLHLLSRAWTAADRAIANESISYTPF